MNTTFSRRALALVAVTGLTLAACGGDEPAPAAAPATEAAPAAAPAEESMAEESMAEESMSEDSMAEDSMAEDSMADESMSDESMHDTMTDESMTDESMSEDSMTDESMSEDSMADESMSEESMALEAWQTLPITDVDGQTFTLGELVGTPVVLEFFATWCPSCRSQLGATNDAAEQLGSEAAVIALSVETDLDAADVAAYAADNGFDAIRFAVMTPEMLAAVVDAFGQSAANPPSTPKVVIDAMGHAGELTTGAESADALVAAVRG